MPSERTYRLVKDDFLSEAFALEWHRLEPRLTPGALSQLPALLADTSAPSKVDVRVAADQVRLFVEAEEHGFRLGNTKVTFARPPGPASAVVGAAGIRLAPLAPDQEPALLEHAGELFPLDRYRSDPGLEQARVEPLYRRWLSNNLRGRCREVLAASRDEDLLGFICVIDKPDHVYFELIGVLPGHRGQGIGRVLLEHATQSNADREIRVVTQFHNLAMQRVLMRCGYEPMDTEYVLTRHQPVLERTS